MNDLWTRLDVGFLQPIWLAVGALAVVTVLLLEIGAERRRRQAIRLFAAEHLLPVLTASISPGRRLLKRALLVAAVALVFVALARPWHGHTWNEEGRRGLDVLLAIDCSKSMLTDDVKPNRLERAKLAVEDFADSLPDNRLGLIAFAGDAFLQCPLTLDHGAFLDSVRDLDTDTIPRPGTDIAVAIDEAGQALKSQPANMKFLILVTDGEDLEGRALDAAKNAAQNGLKIYTVGVGTPAGGVIPELDESGATTFHHDANGDIVHSKLDEAALRQIAQLTGGAYLPLGRQGEGLQQIYDRYIATLPKRNMEERREKVVFEKYEYPLGLAILLLIWEFLVRERAASVVAAPVIPGSSPVRRRRRAPVAAASLLLALLACAFPARAATSDVAERDYKSGQYSDAEQKYGEAAEAQPTRHDLNFNQGDAAYRAGEYTEAEDAFRKSLQTPNLNLQENSYYNLGNTQFHHGEAMQKVDQQRTQQLWEQALKSYESALKLKDAADTRHNYEIVKQKLEQLKQQQQQQQQKNQNNSSKNQNQNQQNSQSSQGQNQNSGGQNQQSQGSPQNKSNQSGQNQNQQNGQDQSQQQQQNQNGQDQSQNQPGQAGQEKNAQGQPQSDQNATAQQRARSTGSGQDQQDPGIKSREEAEALLDSLKEDEHHVSARNLNGNTEPPPTASGKDW